ncbi:type II secretion system major pseudopilin GspG [Caulobacter sp. NIBR1757]|uniref:type II secretion system major pseudopilin GspG n=1 Tax=Caulobacter sp. NIBR1757 TaxID=3016000 RepID=UPI0022F02629|nr:type II secretion system major pseudopilin GspG [Caulobacter sp. NIBR1757]WGM40015.1 Type II secretion system protein G [Caulobacter sp. NIBR1757]
MKSTRPTNGYTLTEMLVVIGIIALIAAVLTPALVGQMSRARAKTAEIQLETVATAIETFRDDVGRYPTDAEGVMALVKEPAGVKGWLGPYLRGKKAGRDPWGQAYLYSVAKDGERFEVWTLGSDKRPEGRGAAADLTAPNDAP